MYFEDLKTYRVSIVTPRQIHRFEIREGWGYGDGCGPGLSRVWTVHGKGPKGHKCILDSRLSFNRAKRAAMNLTRHEGDMQIEVTQVKRT